MRELGPHSSSVETVFADVLGRLVVPLPEQGQRRGVRVVEDSGIVGLPRLRQSIDGLSHVHTLRPGPDTSHRMRPSIRPAGWTGSPIPTERLIPVPI